MKFVPHTTSATSLVQMPTFDQRAEMLLERIAIRTCQFGGFTYRDAAMLAHEFHNLQREIR